MWVLDFTGDVSLQLKFMEDSIIGRGVSNANSIIQKNTVYFNTKPHFEAIKQLIFFKIFHNFGLIKGGGSYRLWNFHNSYKILKFSEKMLIYATEVRGDREARKF